MIIYLPPVNPMTAPLTADTRGAIPSQMAIVMSGMFARQNLVPERLTHAEVKKAKQARPTDASAAVDLLCRDFFEDDDDQEMFAAEARSWLARLTPMSVLDVHRRWPEMLKLYDRT